MIIICVNSTKPFVVFPIRHVVRGLGIMSQQEKRTDRRIVRSRRAIIEAFGRLLEERDIDKITVSAIAREANIDRKTFYVHFGTIDGLLDALAEDLVQTIVDEVEEALDGKAPVEEPERAVHTFFTTINEVVCRNMTLNRRLIESSPMDTLLERVRKPFERLIREQRVVLGEVSPELLEYYTSYVLGGIISVYRHWMLAGSDVSIDRVADVADALTMNGLASLEGQLR